VGRSFSPRSKERTDTGSLAVQKDVARYSKKRARELKHDRFRDTTMSALSRLGDRLEGKGRAILYGIAAVVALAVLAGLWSWWSGRRADEARRALGRAIEIAEATVTPSPQPGTNRPTFPNERARAEKAVEEFRAVAANYGDPYREKARYFAAVNLLVFNREAGLNELEALSRSGHHEVAPWAKFALAQAREADGQYDAAANLYNELATEQDSPVPLDSVRLRLAAVYEKQGKKQEAVELLFRIVEGARKALDPEGKPVPQSAAARDAAKKLETLDPTRYAQLPPEPAAGNLSL
jgi:tetratricopeptide (TPR) repeat protein